MFWKTDVIQTPLSFHDMALIGVFSPRVLFLSVNAILLLHLSLISAYKWPSLQYDIPEEELYQGGTTFTSCFNEEECRKRRSPKTSVAAERIRLVRQFSLLIFFFSVDERDPFSIGVS